MIGRIFHQVGGPIVAKFNQERKNGPLLHRTLLVRQALRGSTPEGSGRIIAHLLVNIIHAITYTFFCGS